MKKYLAIDWGEKRIGLALADQETKLALPFKTISSLKELLNIIEEEEIDQLILGQPLKLSANQPLDSSFSNFFELLKIKTKVPISLVDERLSTKARQSLIGREKDKVDPDCLAACIILQNYLDRN